MFFQVGCQTIVKPQGQGAPGLCPNCHNSTLGICDVIAIDLAG